MIAIHFWGDEAQMIWIAIRWDAEAFADPDLFLSTAIFWCVAFLMAVAIVRGITK